jgi:hypothetical protein
MELCYVRRGVPLSRYPISPYRARALAVALKHAEEVIGGRGGPGPQLRAQFIQGRAREHNLDARLYELAWFVDRTSKADHVILSNGTNPAIIGESALNCF